MEVPWRSFWAIDGEFPDASCIEYDFFEDGHFLRKFSDPTKTFPGPKTPTYTVPQLAKEGLHQGGVLVRSWPVEWGLSVALSIPDTKTAWFLADSHELGKYISLSVELIDGIAFGMPLTPRNGRLDFIASFSLTKGLFREVKDMILSNLRNEEIEFPQGRQARTTWGESLDIGAEKQVAIGIKAMQSEFGINPKTVMAATKTMELVDEFFS